MRALDSNGILTFDYGKAYGNLGKWHNPFFVARYAQALYRDWHAGGCADHSLKDRFLLQANWLADHHDETNGMARWTYPFANTYFGVPAGWISGIGQSHIAGVLYRAAHVTGDERFRDIGRKAIEPYFRPMSEGGVVTKGDGGVWVQEVPNPNGTMYNILNGHITGILGLADVADFEEEEALDDLVRQGIDAVKKTIRKFDAGFASFYSLRPKQGEEYRIAPRQGYNLLHVSQMLTLYELDGDPNFLEMAMRLQKYETLDDQRLARGSTNPEKNGPGEAAAFYGLRYWSDNTFPTWYEVRMDEAPQLDGVYLGSYIKQATPRALSVSILADGLWRKVWAATDNRDQTLYLKFAQPVRAAGVRLEIESDNGNNNVAMNAIMPVRSDAALGAVASACNHRGGKVDGVMRYKIANVIDQDPHTNMTVHCDGFVVLPRTTGDSLMVRNAGEPSQTIKVSASKELGQWRQIGRIRFPDQNSLAVPRGEFLRLDFKKRIGWIDGVHISGEEEPAPGITEAPPEVTLAPARFEPGFRPD